MQARSTKPILIERLSDIGRNSTEDIVAIEEPLEISLSSPEGLTPISITMRTPGNDRELAAGFLFTEGIIQNSSDIISVVQNEENRIEIAVSNCADLTKLQRHFYTSSSCGVCGKTSLEAVKIACKTTITAKTSVSREILLKLPELLRSNQEIFESTGGLHACALFNLNGDLVTLREDVGRHNALDKLIGSHLLNNRLFFENKIVLLSGRASFELVQKAAMAGIPFIAAIGAPSSLAIDLAKEHNITLAGFLKRNTFNIYSCPENIT